MRLILIFYTWLNVFYLIQTTEISNFIDFGKEANDEIFNIQSNDISQPIALSVKYRFFNKYYDELRVSKHGLILFGNVDENDLLKLNIRKEFPIENVTFIAPYWINTNIANDEISRIFYREIQLKNDIEIDLLNQITKLVRNGFPKLAGERMLWAFVITFYEIPSELDPTNRNTYQFILTTNGYYSFSLVTYEKLDWSIDSYGNQPLIGFNDGDQKIFYKFNKTANEIVKESNIGIDGQYVFHSTGNISDVQCETSDGLQISPFRGSIFGGYEIRLHGVCFNQTDYEIRIDNQIVDDCRLVNRLYMICTMPMLMDGGQISVELLDKTNSTLIDSTDFLAHVPQDNGELILRNYIDLTQQIVDPKNNQLVLEFQKNEITRKYLFRILIYDYSTQIQSDDQTLYNQTKQRIDLGFGYLNLSQIDNLTISYDQIFSVANDPTDRVHALQISFEIKQKPGWLSSALFIGAKIFTVAANLNSAYCPAWLLLQRDPNEYIEKVPVCPCEVPINPWHQEFHGFRADEGCDGRKPIQETCAYHPKARGCYRKRSDTSWSGAQCCYDEQGLFIEQGKEGAGTLDVVSPDATSWLKKSLGMFGHFFSDFLSYWSCCRSLLISKKMCEAYYKYRPAGRCEHFEMESVQKYGGAHFVTLQRTSYTFNGQGEFTLLALPLFHQEVQIRLKQNSDLVSGISAFAIGSLTTKKRVQFELFPQHRALEIRINSRLIDIPHEEFSIPITIYEDQYLIIKRKTNGAFRLTFPGSPFRFRATIRPTLDFFDFETLVEREKFIKLNTLSVGLLGDLNGLMFPNGTRLSIDKTDQQTLDEYGRSWMISNENSLFHYVFNHSLSQQQICNKFASTEEKQQCEQIFTINDQQFIENDDTRSFYQGNERQLDLLTVTADLTTNYAVQSTFSTFSLINCILFLFVFVL